MGCPPRDQAKCNAARHALQRGDAAQGHCRIHAPCRGCAGDSYLCANVGESATNAVLPLRRVRARGRAPDIVGGYGGVRDLVASAGNDSKRKEVGGGNRASQIVVGCNNCKVIGAPGIPRRSSRGGRHSLLKARGARHARCQRRRHIRIGAKHICGTRVASKAPAQQLGARQVKEKQGGKEKHCEPPNQQPQVLRGKAQTANRLPSAAPRWKGKTVITAAYWLTAYYCLKPCVRIFGLARDSCSPRPPRTNLGDHHVST